MPSNPHKCEVCQKDSTHEVICQYGKPHYFCDKKSCKSQEEWVTGGDKNEAG